MTDTTTRYSDLEIASLLEWLEAPDQLINGERRPAEKMAGVLNQLLSDNAALREDLRWKEEASSLYCDQIAKLKAELEQVKALLDDGCLWVDEMQVGINKWAGDQVGLLARQDNLNAWKREAKAALTTQARPAEEA